MPQRKIVVRHNLGKQEALKRLKSASEQAESMYQEQIAEARRAYNLKYEFLWDNDGGTLKASAKKLGMTKTVSGTIKVTDSQVIIEADIPSFALVALRAEGISIEKAEDLARQEIEKFLSEP
jgi:hypothetical protein